MPDTIVRPDHAAGVSEVTNVIAGPWEGGQARPRPREHPSTVWEYRWALSYHLLPFFAAYRLSDIDAHAVDRYKAAKAREGRLCAAQINKTLKRLAQILELAVDYGYLPRNPAASKSGRRRLKETKPQRSWVEPEQLMVLLAAAPRGHRPVLAMLAGAGLRVGEACALDWRDVNLATGTVTVRESKTDAGPPGRPTSRPRRRAARPQGDCRRAPGDPVFLSRPRNGRRARQTPDNVGRRLKTAIRRANETLANTGIEAISERVSPHSLRRTYASVRAACGDDPVYIAEQLGHEDPTFTIRVYAKAAKRRERLSGDYLAAFDRALEWAAMGSGGDSATVTAELDRVERGADSASQSPTLVPRPRSSAG